MGSAGANAAQAVLEAERKHDRDMKQKEHFRHAVYQTPFHRAPRAEHVNEWHRWKDYTTADAYFDEALEYAAIRNACAVFDLTPMTKHRITGPDALAFLNRLVTRDVAKIKAGKVGYCVWCDDNGQVIDDGTIFHLREGDYRLCSQERQLDWLSRSAHGFDVIHRRGHSRSGGARAAGPDQLRRAEGDRLQAASRSSRRSASPIFRSPAASSWCRAPASRAISVTSCGSSLARALDAVGCAVRQGLDSRHPPDGHACARSRAHRGRLHPGARGFPARGPGDPAWTAPARRSSSTSVASSTSRNRYFNGRRALLEEQKRGSRYRLVRLDIEGNKPRALVVHLRPQAQRQRGRHGNLRGVVAVGEGEHRARLDADAVGPAGRRALGGDLLPARAAVVARHGALPRGRRRVLRSATAPRDTRGGFLIAARRRTMPHRLDTSAAAPLDRGARRHRARRHGRPRTSSKISEGRLRRRVVRGQPGLLSPCCGVPCFPSLAALPEPVEHVIFAVSDASASRPRSTRPSRTAYALRRSMSVIGAGRATRRPPCASVCWRRSAPRACVVCGANGMGFYNFADGIWACGFLHARTCARRQRRLHQPFGLGHVRHRRQRGAHRLQPGRLDRPGAGGVDG